MKRIMLVILAILMLCAVASAQQRPSCFRGVGSLSGTYLITYEGYLMIPSGSALPVPFPGYIMGVISIDSSGKISGSATSAADIIEEFLIQGTVTLKQDCTGTMRLAVTNERTSAVYKEVDKFIVVGNDDALEIRTIVIDAGIPGISAASISKWERVSLSANAAIW